MLTLIAINLVLTLIIFGIVVFLLKEPGDIRKSQKSMMSKIDVCNDVVKFDNRKFRNEVVDKLSATINQISKSELIIMDAMSGLDAKPSKTDLEYSEEVKKSSSIIKSLQNDLILLKTRNNALEKDNQRLISEMELLKVDDVEENVEPVEIEEEEKLVDLVKLVDYTYDSENDGIDKLVDKIKQSLIHHPGDWKKHRHVLVHTSGLEIWTSSQGIRTPENCFEYLHRVLEIWKPERVSLTSSQKEVLVPLIVKVINQSLNNQASQIEL